MTLFSDRKRKTRLLTTGAGGRTTTTGGFAGFFAVDVAKTAGSLAAPLSDPSITGKGKPRVEQI
jgi:hypothetical protein